jgi:hypothetical protein
VKFCEEGLELFDGRDSHHLRTQGGGMWKAFAIPAQMLAHAVKLLCAKELRELTGMFD